MQTGEGVVIEVSGNIAKIRTGRHNDCKNCGACPGNDAIIISAKNPKGAIPGQRVVFEVKEINAVKGAFIVFVLPLITVFVGIMLGWLLGKLIGGYSLTFEILIGAIAFILAIVYIKFFDHSVTGSDKSCPIIVRIL
jgi:sigma-E factor negative regulatory protein RseC